MGSEKTGRIKDLRKISNNLRKDILKMITEAGCGHPGGSLSAADIIAVLYFYQMKYDSKNPLLESRDRFVLSKGHAAPLLYAALAEAGFFPKKELLTLRKLNSRLQGHPVIQSVENKVPGVELTTGSLGQGFSAACGIAKALKIDRNPAKVYVLLGDGECQEGQIWEAAMFASHYKLDNLIAIIDNNGLQIDGKNDEVMKVNPLAEKFQAFGFYVQQIDGHNFDEIINAFENITERKINNGKPSMIIACTVKGKGVCFMEHQAKWHGCAPNEEELKQALNELCKLMEE